MLSKKAKRQYAILVILCVLIIAILSIISALTGQLDYSKDIYLIAAIGNIFVSLSLWTGAGFITTILWYKYPWEKYPKKHLIIEIVALIIWVSFIMTIVRYLTVKFFSEEIITDNLFNSILTALVVTLLITCIHECVFFYKQWKEHFNRSAKLERSNLEAKYETLKTQINPHFLFNSLNTLITYVEDNPKALKYIQNLSDFMRYVLKTREKEVVLLRDEIDISKKYSYLQQARFGKNLNISFDIDEKYFHYCILPLSIQMLIENAIKHNIISKDKPLKVEISVNKENHILVENNLQKKFDAPSTKLGLANITERYGFLTHKNVKITETSDKFAVSLPLVIVDL